MSSFLGPVPTAGPRSAIAYAAAAAALAFLLGGLLAIRPLRVVEVAGAIGFIPLAMISVPAGLTLWVVALFVQTIPGLAISWMLLLLAAAWLGSVIAIRARISELLPGQIALVGAFALLLAWLSLSLLWARDPHMTWHELRPWFTAAAVVLLVGTSIASPSRLRWLLVALVCGGLVSVAIGLIGAGPHVQPTGGYPVPPSNRFSGAEGNPNDLAVELLPVIVLAVGLAGICTTRVTRWSAIAAAVILTVSFAATQSRGGVVAAALMVPAGAMIYWRQRRQVAAAIGLVAVVTAVSLLAFPHALHRVSSVADGGSGRSTLWLVAWRISKDYAPEGIGLNNFRAVAPYYVRRPGALGYVEQIDDPHIVHNTYLQLLAETGVIGLSLFLAVAFACLAAARRAATVFEYCGRPDLAAISRMVLLACLAALAGQLFGTNVEDMRFWVVLALGPALLTVASRQPLPRRTGADPLRRGPQPTLNA